jgi:hypothetical protein
MAELANEFGKAMCEALGIDPGLVRRISVTANAQELLEVHVQVVFVPSLAASEHMKALVDGLREDQKVVSLEWYRPILDITDMVSESKEFEDALRM